MTRSLPILRGVAFAMVVVGLIDPAISVTRSAPVPVDLIVPADRGGNAQTEADDVVARLTRSLAGEVAFDGEGRSAATVAIGAQAPYAPAEARPFASSEARPVSLVTLDSPSDRTVRIVSVPVPAAVPAGWKATIRATVEATGAAGTTSLIVLEQAGVEVARAGHAWTHPVERVDASFDYAPPAPGLWPVTVRVRPRGGEGGQDGDAASTAVRVSERRLKVLVYEPRLSWPAIFVRRALESDRTFEVSSRARSSRALETRAGTPPTAITAAALEPFDAVVVGAPEELSDGEVRAVETFVRRRGGAVVLLPDRRPSGRYLSLTGAAGFDEVLLDTAVELRAGSLPAIVASELALPRQPSSDATTLVEWSREGKSRPAVLAWSDAAGTVVLSGALDAWRFRDRGSDAFGRFWRATVAKAALAAPAPVTLEVSANRPTPDQTVTIRVRVRPTELESAGATVRMPGVSARSVDNNGRATAVRLWPAAEPGTFDGRVQLAAGTHALEVTTGAGAAARQTLSVDDTFQPTPGSREVESLRIATAATGGVTVASDDLSPLVAHLRGLPRTPTSLALHPARSIWFVLLFASVTGAEWLLRRRVGRR